VSWGLITTMGIASHFCLRLSHLWSSLRTFMAIEDISASPHRSSHGGPGLSSFAISVRGHRGMIMPHGDRACKGLWILDL